MDALIDLRYAPIQDDGSEVDPVFVDEVVRFAMGLIGLPDSSEVSITFVDDAYMAKLNEQYRQKMGPTDVLSFECDNIDDGFANEIDEVFSLGDIVIAPDVAFRQSLEYGNTFKEELALLLVHGVLHLDGYDHVVDDDAELMEAKQKEILSKLVDASILVS